MSTGTKIALTILALGGVVLLVCCGGFVWISYQASQGMTTQPDAVRDLTREIADIDVPERFEPAQGMSLDIFFLPETKIASYRLSEAEGQLMLMRVDVPFQQAGLEQQSQQMRQMKQQQNGGMPEIEIQEQETRQMDIGGRTVDVQFAKGQNPDTGKEYRRVMTIFPAEGEGTVFSMLQVEEEAYDEDEVVDMLESVGQGG
jgi:hypothetical protein